MTILNDLIIKKGAIFVADAHFRRGDSSLLEFLKKIPKGVQIFLMGDIFHLLVGSVKSSVNENFELLDLLYKMSFTNEIIYVEGNHDFGLTAAFMNFIESNSQKVSNIRIFSYKKQPIILRIIKIIFVFWLMAINGLARCMIFIGCF